MKRITLSLMFIVVLSTGAVAQDTWTWQNPLPHGNNYNDIFAIDDTTTLAVGDVGTIAKTGNSGVSWTILTSGTLQNLKDICFLNADSGYVVGDSGSVLKTINGGTS